ncbi:LysR family transcriptional regulator [Pseudomonas sp. NFR16]|uniref:LysR family transcriptional regulator n=1 Tax=Pseudomonas sp. NFR16 TaxID=1566248 RepID=UPI0008D00FE0|nr:LysR family transcriptional regulator [Pseudomonas sp. NFR16]SEI46180.1 DNA-binding transcriptional regulator, LysR family [Pseudomonas sp. NFR16]
MLDSIDDLRFFAEVYASGSIRAAAEKLGISPAGGSKRLLGLEDRIGHRLFNRTTRRLSPTTYGEHFHPHVLTILEGVDAAQRVLANDADISGRLRITASATLARSYLSEVVSSYLNRYPKVSVELDLTDRMVDLIAEGVDLAIRYGALEDSTLIAQQITPCRRLVCASPAYWRDHGMPSSPAQLSAHTALIIGAQRRWVFARDDVQEAVRMRGRFAASMGEVVKQMALDGHGVALLADWHVAEDLRAGRLVEALADWSVEPPIGIFAVYPSRENVSPAVRSFIDHLKQQVSEKPLT